MRYILDTHALLWHLSNDARLGADAKRVLNDPRALLIVPVLVLAEAKHAADRKRLPIAFERVLQAILVSPRLTVFPMDLYTVQHLSSQLDIHDSIIVATALYCREFYSDEAVVVTNDRAITESGLVPTVW
jgi:PIN domain nuclease of toxin-antitoxin system